jgi:hypothetical protein
LLFELTLSYSGWRWQMVAASESFEATVAGVQGGLWELGGVSEVLRSDNLSAATHDLRRRRGRALNRRYRELLDHYGLRSSLIQVVDAPMAHRPILREQIAPAARINDGQQAPRAAAGRRQKQQSSTCSN